MNNVILKYLRNKGYDTVSTDYYKLNDYWFGSGTPTYLIEMMHKFHVLPTQIGGIQTKASSFDAPTEKMGGIVPLFYQSGYLTIKDYNPYAKLYLLDIPNNEIRSGLMESLLPYYLHNHADVGLTTIGLMYDAIRQERMDEALCLLQTFLRTVPYTDHTDYEGHYQQLFYVIFSLFGLYVDVEEMECVATSTIPRNLILPISIPFSRPPACLPTICSK